MTLFDRRSVCRLGLAAGMAALVPRARVGTAAAAADPPADDLIGQIGFHFTRRGETLYDIARAYDLGVMELMAANPGIDPWVPGVGVPLILPTAFVLPAARRDGLVLNISELRLYFFSRRKGVPPVQTKPIGVGREGFHTPLGETRVVRKQPNPTWHLTAAERADYPDMPAVVPPGPDNPMGAFALYLGWPTYAIHGTNKPWGVGRRVSRGCIRLYPEDIEELYPQVPVGTRVTVVAQEAKVGWHMGELYLEIHPSLRQLDDIDNGRAPVFEPVEGLQALVVKAAGGQLGRIDWAEVARAERERRGFPIRITAPADAAFAPAAPEAALDGEL
ncbi:MAG: L,D-transpeptidase family protein [Rhodospirillaceae bacterium]|nr:L,D-transpeptidase family protein [Rhodospirillaceae bacterium]